MSILSKIKNAWNTFLSRDPTENPDWESHKAYGSYGGYSARPDRPLFSRGKDITIINAILNRFAVDCSQIPIQHVRLDDEERFIEKVNSDLAWCLSRSANLDQTGKAFIQDAVMSLLDEGAVALVPIDTDISAMDNDTFKIFSIRTGKILEWYPYSIKVECYNERTGKKEEIFVKKETTAIVYNPFAAVMNEPNSILQRIVRKFSLLDVVDEQSSSGKLDLIIQLPYVVKSDARREQAEKRRQEISEQLKDSKYGIAYTDGTEKITQLNRPVENQLMAQIEFLTSMLYSQLGITKEILEGSANEEAMNNYYIRTIEPIMDSLVEEMSRKFLTKTAISQKQAIRYYRTPFKMLPLPSIAEIADKFTRNEIMTANEIRQIIGMKPSSEPGSDDLRNKNNIATPNINGDMSEEEIQNGSDEQADVDQQMAQLDENDKAISELEDMLKQADSRGGRYIKSYEK